MREGSVNLQRKLRWRCAVVFASAALFLLPNSARGPTQPTLQSLEGLWLTDGYGTGGSLLIKEADPRLLASGHEMNARRDIVVSEVAPYNRIHSPSSNLLSRLNDMARWAIANMNRGRDQLSTG
jgi:hypothetical protein